MTDPLHRAICDVIYEMVNALGAAMPRTPQLQETLDALVAADIDADMTKGQ